MQPSARTLATAVVTLLLAVLGQAGGVAAAASGSDDVPSVDVIPAEVGADQPNDGQWFVLELEPGQTERLDVILRNPADVPQRVAVYMRDLAFDDGTPSLLDSTADVSSWVQLSRSEVLVPPRSDSRITLTATPPANAEPGDHSGAVVAESEPSDGDIQIVKRVATRFTVTVPGEATRDAELVGIDTALDNALWPTRAALTVKLRNTGRIRLAPTVEVDGRRADGSEVLLSQSTEPYVGAAAVPWYGGPVEIPVAATSEAGVQRSTVSLFVIPWALIAVVLLVLCAVAVLITLLVLRRRRRAAEQAELDDKLRRLAELEQSLPQQRSADETVRS